MSRYVDLGLYAESNKPFRGELRTKGLIDGTPDNRVILPVGRDIAGPQEPLPTGAALVPYWLPRLTKSEATMLQVIYDHGTISREDLAPRGRILDHVIELRERALRAADTRSDSRAPAAT